MHDLPLWIILWRWCGGLLGIAMNAATALPLITALTLLIGRRAQARFSSFGAARLARLGFGLSCLGLPLLLGNWFLLLNSLKDAGWDTTTLSLTFPPLLSRGVPLLLWLLGMLCAGLLSFAFARTPLPPRRQAGEDQRPAGTVKGHLCLCGLTALCFFAVLVSHNWPYVALPAGMTLGQVASAIVRDAVHNYFMALAPAGALALLFLFGPRAQEQAAAAGFDEEQTAWAVRWCALWATVGYIPFCLDRWGLAFGYMLRADLPDGFLALISGLVPLTLGMACWGTLLGMARPLRRAWLMGLGAALLVLKESLPFLFLLAGRG